MFSVRCDLPQRRAPPVACGRFGTFVALLKQRLDLILGGVGGRLKTNNEDPKRALKTKNTWPKNILWNFV